MQKKSRSEGAAFPGTKCFVRPRVVCRRFEYDSKSKGVVLVRVPQFARHDCIAALVELYTKAMMLDELMERVRRLHGAQTPKAGKCARFVPAIRAVVTQLTLLRAQAL
jgi:hypothetical protein